ncbi:MAG: FtsX-like permease family protein [Bacteroidales bacterium]|nr:FtsX-like permease family protein [Bacteroidales bacterium]
MSLPFHIALRYLFARKISLVNVISIISVVGVAGMTAALIVILSVFNGFDSLISSMINQFDPEIKITVARGKTFDLDSTMLDRIANVEGVASVVRTIEETALFQYDDYQHIASIKGVDYNYSDICNIAGSIYSGSYRLWDDQGVPYAVVGADVASYLWIQTNSARPICVYAPLRGAKVSLNPDEAFQRGYIVPSGIFHIHQDFDSKYVIVPIEFASAVLHYGDQEISSLELSVVPGADADVVAAAVSAVVGDAFVVRNRFQQQDTLYKIMQSEKLSIFVMLSFIIVIASFNIIGALTMLIIDKQRDIQILSHLGATRDFVRRIFMRTGQLITITGAASGLVLGVLICWAQTSFGFLKFPEGSYIIDTYPVEIRLMDVLASVAVVVVIGFVASLIPVRKISDKNP